MSDGMAFAEKDFCDLPKSSLTHKPVLHFVHANGIPSATYEPLFEIWERYFSLEMIDYLGMDSRYPIDDNWHSLTCQVMDSIDKACTKHGVPSVVAVGHSVGAVITLQALARHSNQIDRAVLLDPAIMMGRHSLAWFLAKQTNRIPFIDNQFSDRMSPAAKSKYRKDTFSSRSEAYEKLRQKGLFQAFDERCFQAYINKGFVDNDNGVTLAIHRSAEVAIFRTMPMNYWYKKLTITKPVTLIAGKNSEFTKMGSYVSITKRFGIKVIHHDGSHMFPLEYPDSVARMVLASFCQYS